MSCNASPVILIASAPLLTFSNPPILSTTYPNDAIATRGAFNINIASATSSIPAAIPPAIIKPAVPPLRTITDPKIVIPIMNNPTVGANS